MNGKRKDRLAEAIAAKIFSDIGMELQAYGEGSPGYRKPLGEPIGRKVIEQTIQTELDAHAALEAKILEIIRLNSKGRELATTAERLAKWGDDE